MISTTPTALEAVLFEILERAARLHPAVVYAVVGITTALLIRVLFLRPVNDTHRWIRLGPLSFQPVQGSDGSR